MIFKFLLFKEELKILHLVFVYLNLEILPEDHHVLFTFINLESFNLFPTAPFILLVLNQ